MLYRLLNFVEGLKYIITVWSCIEGYKPILQALYDSVYYRSIKEYHRKPYFQKRPYLIKYDVMGRVLMKHTDYLIIEQLDMSRLPRRLKKDLLGLPEDLPDIIMWLLLKDRLPLRITGINWARYKNNTKDELSQEGKKLLERVNNIKYNEEYLEFEKELLENGIDLNKELDKEENRQKAERHKRPEKSESQLLKMMRESSNKYKEYMKTRQIPEQSQEYGKLTKKFFMSDFLAELDKNPERKKIFLASACNKDKKPYDFSEDIKHYPDYDFIKSKVGERAVIYGNIDNGVVEQLIRPTVLNYNFLVNEGAFGGNYETIEDFNFLFEKTIFEMALI